MRNPVLEPLVGQCRSCDIVIVQVNPICRDALPSTVKDTTNRVTEISFNSSLLREMRAIAWGNALVEAGVMEIKDARYRCIRFHHIAAEEIMAGLGGCAASSTPVGPSCCDSGTWGGSGPTGG